MMYLKTFLHLFLLTFLLCSNAIAEERNYIEYRTSSRAIFIPWLGMGLQGPSQAGKGASVSVVEEGGPAALAGIKEGDILVSINGQSPASYYGTSPVIEGIGPVLVEVDRQGSILTYKVLAVAQGESGTGPFCLFPDGNYGIIFKKLGLDEFQRRNADGLFGRYMKDAAKLSEEIRSVEARLQEQLLKDPVDLAETRKSIESSGFKRTALRLLRVRAFEEFKGLLDTSQRELLRVLFPAGVRCEP